MTFLEAYQKHFKTEISENTEAEFIEGIEKVSEVYDGLSVKVLENAVNLMDVLMNGELTAGEAATSLSVAAMLLPFTTEN